MSGNQALTQGQSFKFSFLIGLFLTNASRCLVLVYELSERVIFDKAKSEVHASTMTLALTELPTLFLMTSFSLFVYYIA